MPLQPNNQDPIVQILILAYRRGLAIKQNSQPEQIAGMTPLNAQSPRATGGAIAQTARTQILEIVPAKDDNNASTIT